MSIETKAVFSLLEQTINERFVPKSGKKPASLELTVRLPEGLKIPANDRATHFTEASTALRAKVSEALGMTDLPGSGGFLVAPIGDGRDT